MIEGLSPSEFQRRVGWASARMTPLQRDIMHLLRSDETSYADVAGKLGIAEEEVCEAFAAALMLLDRAFEQPIPWWRRLLRR